jgi:hypothetical protein
MARKKSRRAMPRKLADTNGQIERLWQSVSEQCVSIASSIDTIPAEMIPHVIRARWSCVRAGVALARLVNRLTSGPVAIAARTAAAHRIRARQRPRRGTDAQARPATGRGRCSCAERPTQG